jgi:hypothetical protein
MSTTSAVGGPSVVQTLAKALLAQYDTDGDGRLSSNEFEGLVKNLVSSLTTASSTAAAASSTATAASGGPYEFRGFDASRAVSAAGSLKYDAYNVLQRFDPTDPTSMKRAFQELSVVHPGQYELDSQDNLMLTGTADGYIGARPDDRNSDWTNRNQAWNWQWMGYNVAHPGPNGELT